MTVSVIIPVYNSRQFVRQAVESVFRQNIPLELIIVNDCSEDHPEEVLEDFLSRDDVILIKNKVNSGLSASRNVGVRAASKEYIAFLDADDIWAEGKLSKQIEVMKDSQCVICHTARQLLDHFGNPLDRIIHVKKEVDYRQLLKHNSIACSSVLIPRDLALEVPMSHDDCHEDYLTWLRVLKKTGKKACGIDEPLLLYRLSAGSKSRNKFRSANMTYRVHRYMDEGRIKALINTGSHLAYGVKKYSKGYKI